MVTRKVNQASTITEETEPQRVVFDPYHIYGNVDRAEQLKTDNKYLILDGTSYSGTDIKLLVHKYSNGSQDMSAALQEAIGVYGQVKAIVASLGQNAETAILTLHNEIAIDIVDQADYGKELDKIWTSHIRKVASLESTLSLDFGFNQHFDTTLRNLTISLQQNPSATRTALLALEQEIGQLVDSWRTRSGFIRTGQISGQFYQTKILSDVQTISVSSFRDKKPVTVCGNTGVKGFTRGHRTIAGSIIFTVFDRNSLFNLLDINPSQFDADNKFKAGILDQLPPMDVTIMFANEYGSLSRMTIYGMEFFAEGKTMSIEDLLLENVVQYVARDLDPMTPVVNEDGKSFVEVLNNYNQAIHNSEVPSRGFSASDLMGSDFAQEYDNSADRSTRRKNPFF